jgi:hypothetical protein
MTGQAASVITVTSGKFLRLLGDLSQSKFAAIRRTSSLAGGWLASPHNFPETTAGKSKCWRAIRSVGLWHPASSGRCG